MKKILLSAAALAVFLGSSPAGAIFDGSKKELISELGEGFAVTLNDADTPANNIKVLLPQLYTAVQMDNIPGVNLTELKNAITEKTFGTSGYLMKYIKKVAELGNNLKNAKSVSTLKTRVSEIEKDQRKSSALNMFVTIYNAVVVNPSQYPNTFNVMCQIAEQARVASLNLYPIAVSARNGNTTVYPYLLRLPQEYVAIYNSTPMYGDINDLLQQTAAQANAQRQINTASTGLTTSVATQTALGMTPAFQTQMQTSSESKSVISSKSRKGRKH